MVAAAIDAVKVAVDVEPRGSDVSLRADVGTVFLGHVLWRDPAGVVEVEVFGEDHGRQPDAEGALAGLAHPPGRGCYGPPMSQDHSLCTWLSAGRSMSCILASRGR